MLKVKRLNDAAILPKRATDFSAGFDLFSTENVIIEPQSTSKIDTGIAIAMNKNQVGLIFARSGLAIKQGLRPANCVGVIDADYRGNVIVALYNDSDIKREINIGDRIAQLVVMNYDSEFEECQELDNTERGVGGFGSTGKWFYYL